MIGPFRAAVKTRRGAEPNAGQTSDSATTSGRSLREDSAVVQLPERQWRVARGPHRRPHLRELEVTEDPCNHRWGLNQRRQSQPPPAPRTRQDVEAKTHQPPQLARGANTPW